MDSLQRDVNQKFDKIDERFDRIDERLNKVEIGLATLTEKVGGMDKRLEKVENEQVKQTGLAALTEKVGGMDNCRCAQCYYWCGDYRSGKNTVDGQ